MSFDADISIHRVDGDRYRCAVSPKHWLVSGPNGGHLAALLARAGELHLRDDPRQLRGLTVHYLRPPAAGPATIEVTTEQHGRSVTYQRLVMVQDGKKMLLATGSWADSRDGIDVDLLQRPSAPPPEQCKPLASVHHDGPLPIHEQWDIRSASGRELGSGPPAQHTWWIRPPEHRRLDGPMLIAMCDAMPPPVFMVAAPVQGVPTIDLTMHTRADLARVAWNPGDWVLARFESRFAGNGYVEEDGDLWTADGTLLAQSRQLALAV